MNSTFLLQSLPSFADEIMMPLDIGHSGRPGVFLMIHAKGPPRSAMTIALVYFAVCSMLASG